MVLQHHRGGIEIMEMKKLADYQRHGWFWAKAAVLGTTEDKIIKLVPIYLDPKITDSTRFQKAWRKYGNKN